MGRATRRSAACCRRRSKSSCPSGGRSGIGRLGQQLYLVDAHGVVIDEYGPQYADFDLPIIDGLVPRRRTAARPAIDRRRAELAARVIDGAAARRRASARRACRRSTSATRTTPS